MKHAVVPLTGNDQILVSGCGWITFVSLSETSGSALVHTAWYDGLDATGQKIVDLYQPQGTAIFSGIGTGRLGFRNGLFIHNVSGGFAGSFSLKMCDGPAEWY